MKLSLAKGFAYLTSASFVGTLTQIIKGKLMAVLLGTSGVGIFSQLSHLFNLLFSLSSLGFRNGIIKKVSQAIVEGDDEKIKQQYASVFIFLTILSIVIVSIAGLLSPFISHLLFSDHGEKSCLVLIMLMSVPFAVMANIYRSLLSGYMAVKPIVKAQIFADIISLIPFVFLLLYANLVGAVLAFVAYQLMKMIFYAGHFHRVCNFQIGLPKLNSYNWGDIHANISFGLSGLFLTSLNIAVMIFVSRHIIAELGLQENGLFSVALKVATVYLGAVYANASSYYFPLLAKSSNSASLSAVANRTNRFYFYLLPPLIIIIMTGGEWMMGILFSKEFSPAALLLFLLLPGDLFRISAETLGLPLLVKEKFLAYNALYCWWCCVYVSLAMYMIEIYGLLGVAIAYLLSHIINFLTVAVVVRLVLEIKISRGFVLALFLAVASLAVSSGLNLLLEDFWLSVLINTVVILVWFAFSCLQKEFVGYLNPLLKRMKS
tara:strand:+ start:7205 stop:8671 length:1467 start_codon:yes stop_codon:yes gene_type:complete